MPGDVTVQIELTLEELEAICDWYHLANGEFGPIDDPVDLDAYKKIEAAINSPPRWKAQISGQIRTVTAAQDYSRELYDPEAEFWRKADGIC